MHWIRAWCAKQCGNKRGCMYCRSKCWPVDLLAQKAECSPDVLRILLYGGVTHPNIAKRITNATGCGETEWNEIVNKIHHGHFSEYKGTPPPRSVVNESRYDFQSEPVVAIRDDGTEIGRFPSIVDAADEFGTTNMTVGNRCRRKCKPQSFKRLRGIFFRFAKEWDMMDEYARAVDIGLIEQEEDECTIL